MWDVESLSEVPPWDWPDDAAGTLLRVLRDSAADVEERLLAIELASNTVVMNDEIAETLLAILRDPAQPEEVRGAAAISLGPTLEELDMELDDYDDPEEVLVSPRVAAAIPDALHEVYLDAGAPKFVRRRALEASVRALADWHAGAVRAAYYSDDPEWRVTGVFGMAHLRGFEREILEALESGDHALRYEAVRAAGNREVKEAWPQVSAIVRNERDDKALLLAAIEAVPTIRPSEAADVLSPLRSSDDEEIAEAVAEALAMAEVWDDMDDDDDRW